MAFEITLTTMIIFFFILAVGFVAGKIGTIMQAVQVRMAAARAGGRNHARGAGRGAEANRWDEGSEEHNIQQSGGMLQFSSKISRVNPYTKIANIIHHVN